MAKQQVSEYSEKTKPIQKQISEGTIIIYPNPTKGQISVEINGFKSSMEGSLNIYDMQGKLILKESITTTHKNLDISSSPDGIYIMTIIIDEDKHQWKIVKE
ncbi:MAG: T9SS type A sorting domain-containing protein [Clostridium baratii]